jgi:transposase InsO family protein
VEVVYPRCCGLDVQKNSVVACVVDACSRLRVGWQASRSLRTDLALDAPELALWRR